MGYRRGLIAAALLAALTGALAWAQETPTPVDPNDAYFRAALARMNALPTPPALIYTAAVQTDGGTVEMRQNSKGVMFAMFYVGTSPATNATFTFSLSDRTHEVSLVGGSAQLGPMPAPFFDPTWSSAYRWMQNRLLFRMQASEATPTPEPSALQLKTIAVVAGTAGLSYHVVSVERNTCPNGDSALGLHVVPVRDPDNHPLVGVVVDDRTNMICTMQFDERAATSGGTDGRAVDELWFAKVRDFYMVVRERMHMHMTVTGTQRSMSADVALGDFRF